MPLGRFAAKRLTLLKFAFMPKIFSRVLLTLLALISGAILGYFVFDMPIIPIAAESVIRGLAPILKGVDAWFFERGEQYLFVAALIFIAAIPNVALLAVAVALTMKLFRRPRTVFYATLACPILHFIFEWEKVVRIMARLEQLGFNHDLETVLRAESLHTKAATLFLVYLLFSVLVFALFRQFSAARHNPAVNTDATR